MKQPPTDYQLLRAIYERHQSDYANSATSETRQAKIAVPIDIPTIAYALGSDPDTVFGRLYYHLDPQYEQVNRDGSRKHLFHADGG